MSQETGFAFFWWSLNIEDLALNDNGRLEKAGLEDNEDLNARDRNVKLEWSALKFMLHMIAKVDCNKELYKSEYWERNHHSWTLLPNGIIEQARPST